MTSTRERIPAYTDQEINQRSERRTERRVRNCAQHPEEIGRLAELDEALLLGNSPSHTAFPAAEEPE